MELVRAIRNIGPDRNLDWEIHFGRAAFSLNVYMALRKVIKGVAIKEEISWLERALDFFRGAKLGHEVITKASHKIKWETVSQRRNIMDDLGIVLNVLVLCNMGQCLVHDKDFEAGRKTLFKFAKQQKIEGFIDKCLTVLEEIVQGHLVKPDDAALPAFFFKVMQKEASAKM